jgi:hypothetical protein
MSRIATGWIPTPVGRTSNGEGCDEEEGDGALIEDHAALQSAERLTRLMPMNAQRVADAQGESWGSEWLVGADPPPPLPVWPAAMGTVLPTLCVSAALAACRSFPAATGLGWDKAHPRALERLPVEGIRALLRIFILSEVLGSWPRGIGVILVALLPKPGGGLRPIGLLPSLVRVWMRIRLPVAQAWQVANDRSYFYAGPSKGATVAAWRQSARAELA